MIITLILAIGTLLGILFIVLGVAGAYRTRNGDEISIGAGCGISLVFGFSLICCLIIIAVANNTSYIKSNEYKYSEKIKLFKNNKTLLESYKLVTDDSKVEFTSNITFEKLSTEDYYNKVAEYNKEVYDFKVSIKEHQYNRNNLWINWLVCPAAYSVTDETLDSLTYTIGK
jgi:ABC-type transport system involved in multi-copper enzyme maturation permease subunit